LNLTTIDFLLITLATWRLARFITRDDAPFALMKRFRDRFAPSPESGLRCIYCTSIWTALLITLVYVVGGVIGQVVVVVLAASAGGLMLASFSGVSRE